MLEGVKSVFFIGIGGAGMSALARILHERGFSVSGSDIKSSQNTERLKQLGVKVFIGHNPSNVEDADVVVCSSAILPENPELLRAVELGKQVVRRGELLALIANPTFEICVSGTHGKTTTTSMIAFLLDVYGLKPTIITGGELNDIGTNAKNGSGQYTVCESDESDGSILYLAPDIAVITNVDADHLDFFGSFERIKELFLSHIRSIKPQGWAVACGDDEALVEIAKNSGRRSIFYGIEPENDVRATEVEVLGTGTTFVAHFGKDGVSLRVRLKVAGLHNVRNALGALGTAWLMGLDLNRCADILTNFSGVRRRLELKGSKDGVDVYDDYAHHPAEIRATLSALRSITDKRIFVVFQPHRFTRTAFLYTEFGASFADADVVVVTDIYPAGERPLPGVTGKLIADSVAEALPDKELAYVPGIKDVVEYVSERVQPGDVLVTMGAGDIWMVGERFLSRL